jgi:hypothetical protein
MIIYWFLQERRGGVPKIYFKGQQIAGSIVPLGVSLRGARTLPESLVRWPGSIARAHGCGFAISIGGGVS